MLRDVGIGAHEQQSPARDVRHARPDLLPVHDPLVAVAHRRRRERRDVGTGAGLAEHLAPDLFARERRPQEPALLLLGAERDQRGTGHADAHHVAQQVLRRVGRDESLVDEVLEAGVEPEAALALGEVDPGQTEIELGAPEFLVRRARGARPAGARCGPRRRSRTRPAVSVALVGAMAGTLTCAYSPRQPWRNHGGIHGRRPRLHERARPGRDDPATATSRRRELVDGYLERIERTRPAPRLVPHRRRRPRSRRRRRRRGASSRRDVDDAPFLGVPVSIKDLADTAGIRTTHGTATYADRIPDVDDEVVARIRRAGS